MAIVGSEGWGKVTPSAALPFDLSYYRCLAPEKCKPSGEDTGSRYFIKQDTRFSA